MVPTWSPVFPVRLPKVLWTVPVAESMYDLREEDWLSDMFGDECKNWVKRWSGCDEVEGYLMFRE